MPDIKQIHFVTGRLAEHLLLDTLNRLAPEAGFEYTVQVLPISVAALLTPSWIAPRLVVPDNTQQIVLPGYCDGDLTPITQQTSIPVSMGPKDLRELPQFFGKTATPADLNSWSIEIIAEINHTPRMELMEIVSAARVMANDGADMIDVGCEPDGCWHGVGDCVKALKDEGLRVSIDSLNPLEIAAAVDAGAELVLSVNKSNRHAAPDWGCEVVVIPEDIRDISTIEESIEFLSSRNVPLRLDPVLQPIGLGLAGSIGRYIAVRQRWPDAPMMMGIGNLTELTDTDSAGVNFLLLGICEELRIHSVLTTEVINWARSSVKECDIARRLVHFARRHQVPPKNLSRELVSLRDPKLTDFGADHLRELSKKITDSNYRIFADDQEIHLLGSGKHLHDKDPFALFDLLSATNPKNLDASHAFYLGYEMCKAMTALTLAKQYVQDEALNWGHLTRHETNRHRLSRRFRKGDK